MLRIVNMRNVVVSSHKFISGHQAVRTIEKLMFVFFFRKCNSLTLNRLQTSMYSGNINGQRQLSHCSCNFHGIDWKIWQKWGGN